jgi:transposase
VTAEIKVCDPVSVPLSILVELQEIRTQLGRLRQDNDRLRLENERLKADLEQAKAALAEATRASKRQAAPFAKGPPKPHPKKPGRKPGASHGRHAHRPAPAPDQVDEVLDAPLPDACPDCGGTLRPTGVARQYQAEIPRRPLIRQFNVHLGCCRGCGKHAQGRHPLQTSDALGACASQVGPDAQAAVVGLNKTLGLSHAKVAWVFTTLFGIPLTRGASAQIVPRAAGRLEPADQEICHRLKASARLTPDETGWRVAGRPAWLHAWVGPDVVCYAIEADRSAAALEGQIGPAWAGQMVHDGFASYDRFEKATHQQCLGHVLRRLRELLGRASRGAVRYPRRLISLFTEAIHLRNRYLEGEVTAEDLGQTRAGFERRLREAIQGRTKVAEYRTLSKHLLKHLQEWFTFLSHPEVEPTNWEAEQAIRPAVVNRKVWGGNRTWAGAHAQEVLMSVWQTCQRLWRPALDFVSQTLRAFGNPRLSRPVLFEPR